MTYKWLFRAAMALSMMVWLIAGLGRYGVGFLYFALVGLLAAGFLGWMERDFQTEGDA
jgi:hypothetical protein